MIIINNRQNQLVQIATLYYEEGLTQTTIAKKLNLSRPTVASMLKEAREEGIVKITIQHTDSNNYVLQDKIAKKYHLKSVLISSKRGNSQSTRSEIGSLCATLIERRLPDINSLGIGWGTTMYEFVQAAKYTSQPHLSIVPLIGGIGLLDVSYHSNHLAFTLAQKYNCQVNYFYAPAIADTLEMKHSLENSELIKQICEKGKNVDWAVVAVGNPLLSSTYRQLQLMNPTIEREIQNSAAIGDVLASFYDINGNSVHSSLSDRMIGISLEDLEKIKNVVVIAAGKEKQVSVKALLQKKLIDYLIIDPEIAEYLDEDVPF